MPEQMVTQPKSNINLNLASEQTLADVLPDAIIMLNPDATINWWNKQAQDLFFLKQQQHNGIHINQLIDKKNFDFDTAKKITAPIEITLANRPKIRISVSLIAYIEDQYLLFIQNITHVYRLEKMRQDFLANVSHELRTPLTVIHGYLESLLDQNNNADNPWHNIFTQMHQQSLRMERLVNDLLLLSRLEVDAADGHNFQPIAIAPILTAICNDARTLSGNQQHQIICNLDQKLQIYGVEEELRSAFSNIIINAVKYTPAKGTINITWHAVNNKAILEVQDTGIGLAAEDIPRLTERFYRVDRARSRASGGTGLGLAIVKHVLIRHRARLKITSELGKGSLFKCVFPGKSIVGCNSYFA